MRNVIVCTTEDPFQADDLYKGVQQTLSGLPYVTIDSRELVRQVAHYRIPTQLEILQDCFRLITQSRRDGVVIARIANDIAEGADSVYPQIIDGLHIGKKLPWSALDRIIACVHSPDEDRDIYTPSSLGISLSDILLREAVEIYNLGPELNDPMSVARHLEYNLGFRVRIEGLLGRPPGAEVLY